MRWLTNDSHRDFFESQSSILFENLFTQEEINLVLHAVTLALGKRTTAQEIFKDGYDLSRKSPALRETVCKKFLARIASELLGKNSVRLAYDQIIKGPFSPEHNSFQTLLGGALLPLTGEKKGHVIFFNQNFKFENEENDLALVIGYAERKSLYVFNELDSHTHFLKSLGYVFGDALTEKTHPLLYTREL